MDLLEEENLDRKNTLKQFENYFNNATNKLKNFVEQIGWTLDKTPMNVSYHYSKIYILPYILIMSICMYFLI